MLALDFLCTSSSSILANVVTHPFELVKVRQQAAVLGETASFGRVWSGVVRDQGFLGLYRGFNASVVRAIISGGGRQTIFYGLKQLWGAGSDKGGSAPVRTSLAGACVPLGRGALTLKSLAWQC
jgi:hypothetical protein